MTWWMWMVVLWPVASVVATALFCAMCRASELDERRRELARVRVRAHQTRYRDYR